MLCGVTATLGSNPSATATAARPHWGRAVLLCPRWRMRVLGVAVWRWLLLVAPLVFRAPEGPAAREARRPHFVRRRASKPARALRSLRRLPHQWGRVADVLLGARLEARPGPAAAQGRRSQAVRSLRRPPRLWGWVADVWLGASARCPARPRRRPRAPQPVPPVRSMCVVTNVVNRRCFSIRCYKRRQSDGFLAENGGFLA